MSLASIAPRAPSSALGRVAPIVRTLDPIIGKLALGYASIEPLSPHRMPGRSSGPSVWRSPDAVPAPSARRRIVHLHQ
jgi:hypothetical protein